MYNKLFTKILDSSIWLEPTPTRIVWMTLIAAMDESGFAQFASVGNLAHRAIVDMNDAQKAVESLEGPDPESSDPENDGRRIERVPGGWMVLNAEKYRQMVTRAVIQEQTRIRVQKHRAKSRQVTHSNGEPLNVTPSEADTDTEVLTPLTPLSGGRVTRDERKQAETIRKNRLGCQHFPRCEQVSDCLQRIVGEMRGQREDL